ncbi:MAG: hypothetical protein M1167_03575, partial [Chloroflexi bacterium]|nr:hypothetical protein [Chloroflexota bacterium]
MSDEGKELVSSISQIITAIQTLFFGLFLIALNSNSFYSNLLPWSLAMAVVLPITGFQIFSGVC